MKVFRRKPGVELLEICGEYLLVATKDARESCPYVTQINKSAAEYWKIITKPTSANELIEQVSLVSGKEKKAVFLYVLSFIDKMIKSGYLIEEEIS